VQLAIEATEMTALWRFLTTDPGFALVNAALIALAVVVAA
jgi:hypothetical protein